MITVREETIEDFAAVDTVNELAFGRRDEAELVKKLRDAGKMTLSLVAEMNDRVVGHVLFSPMRIIAENGAEHAAVGLGPVAVHPQFQRQGVGSSLIDTGLEQCRREGHGIILVLGHPSYYPRFGFRPAVEFEIRCVYDVPEDAFMALELTPGALNQISGTAFYAPEFDGV